MAIRTDDRKGCLMGLVIAVFDLLIVAALVTILVLVIL